MPPLRAGVIGLGVGKSHAEGYHQSPHSTLVAICDSNPQRLAEYAQKYQLPASACFSDYQTMLAQSQLDIVSVCLPNALHAPATIAAHQAGAHVLCEKPLAINAAEAQAMLDAAQRSQRHLMVCYNYRYRADSQWLYHVVHSGQLGQIYHVSASWRRETGIPGWGLFADQAMSGGGALIDLGVHVLDLALWLLDFPAVKTASGQTRALFGPRRRKMWLPPGQTPPPFEVEDGAVGFLRLASGASMFLQATWGEHTLPLEDHMRVELQGTEGSAILDIPNYRKEDTLRLYTEIEHQAVTITPSVRWDAPAYQHIGLVLDVVEKLAQGVKPTTDGQQGLTAVRVLDALYESARKGQEIQLD
ncbi:MAG: Gfo/Idh/MocA family oxidoreductase [Chloroflexi bacterium]|nr:Gfo/Idh/MocA family oxidoreductase [Chloroflexota bacterium]